LASVYGPADQKRFKTLSRVWFRLSVLGFPFPVCGFLFLGALSQERPTYNKKPRTQDAKLKTDAKRNQ
jgi:hypothetical protein